MTLPRIGVSGASGLVGSALVSTLRAAGWQVLTIGRRGSARPDVEWDPATAVIDGGALAGVDAVVHLAGAPIGRRWTATRRREIRESRVDGTRLIADAVARLRPRPRVLIAASAVGFYGSRGDEVLSEESGPGSGFLADVSTAWERASDPARMAGLRVVHARSGLVLSSRGGALSRLLPPFRLGLGGRLGDGRQWMSWIALPDLVAVLRFALERDGIVGPVNAVSPSPVTNSVFTATLAQVLRRPAVIPLPARALRALFGEMAVETMLASQRVRPAVLEREGFPYEHPTLERALRHELRA